MESPTKSDLEKLCHHSQIYFAIFCAEQVFHLVELKYQPVCRQAIDIAKLFIEGKATKEECKAAANAAYAATHVAYAANATAVDAAAYAATHAAKTAAFVADAITNAAFAAYAAAADATYAVNVKDKQAIIEAQWEYYKELLAFETIIEDVLLA